MHQSSSRRFCKPVVIDGHGAGG